MIVRMVRNWPCSTVAVSFVTPRRRETLRSARIRSWVPGSLARSAAVRALSGKRVPLRCGVTSISLIRDRIARRLVATLLVAATTALHAQDNAFTALLSLPQGVPEDSSFPPGPQGDDVDQKALQARLATAFESGEDVNAYLYGGTLLHHALRANLQDTALWLLAHGADPKLEVQVVESGKPDGHDALQLAIVYRRWRVVDALLRRPAVAPHTARELAFRWSAVFDVRGDGSLNETARELARRLAWPGDWYGGCLAAAAADRAVLPMLAKAAGAPAVRRPVQFAKTLKGRDLDVASNCGLPEARFGGEPDRPGSGLLATLSPAELARIDAHLAEPLLPALAMLLETPADVQKWSTLTLRRPWQDATFTRALVQALVRTPMKAAVRDAALHEVPPAALRVALDDDATLRGWVDRLWHQPLPQAQATLAAIDDAVLARHAEAAIAGLAGESLGLASHTPYANRAQKASDKLWIALLSRLPAPLQFRPDLPILTLAPDSAWPALFARGYVPAPARLEAAWRTSTVDQWRDRWPMLRAVVSPQNATALMANLIAAWASPCTTDECAPQPADPEKLQVMLAAGVRPPPVVTLSTGAARRAEPATVRALVSTRLVTLAPADAALAAPVAPAPSDAPLRGRFELTPLACAPEPDTATVRAALHGAFLANAHVGPLPPQTESVTSTWFQPVAEPGAKSCAWLVSGGDVASRMSFDEDDFYEGRHHFTPCGEATLYGEVWRRVDGRLVAAPWGEGATGGALALQESGGSRRFVLALPFRGGTCDAGRSTTLFEWVGDASNRRLLPRTDDGPARRALDAQCNAEDPAPCFGQPSMNDAAVPADTPGAMLSQDTFVERYGGALRQRWLDAFQAGDLAALRTPELSEPMPEWRRAGLAALTASTLPLDQKRQRVAWMFRDKAGMAASFGQSSSRGVILGLVAWLPREDWRPMLAAIGQDPAMLLSLRGAATAKGDARLACTFAKAAGRECVAPQ